MRFLLNILFLFLSINISFSQDDYRTWIKGKVLYKNVSVPSANVINNTSQAATTTNDDGEFEMEVKLNDKLIFSSVQYQICLLYTSPSPRDISGSRMPSSA